MIRFHSKLWSSWLLLVHLQFKILSISFLNALQKKYFLTLPKHVGAEVQFPMEQVISDGPSKMYPGRETYLTLAPAR